MEKYGYAYYPTITESKAELELIEYFKNKGIIFEKDREILSGKELDGYCKEHNIAFEYCGRYWHNEDKINRGVSYHYNKWKVCADNGIDLITIWDNWNMDLVKTHISRKLYLYEDIIDINRIEFRMVCLSEASQFHAENHLQGSGSRLKLFSKGVTIMEN